mmetsp:Transcript_3092/g.8604  ORF Transcript_3092/g.8604 Transcript_3092/m.8604 type:complete len:459 (+) Transcript_3092:2-1378(+)
MEERGATVGEDGGNVRDCAQCQAAHGCVLIAHAGAGSYARERDEKAALRALQSALSRAAREVRAGCEDDLAARVCAAIECLEAADGVNAGLEGGARDERGRSSCDAMLVEYRVNRPGATGDSRNLAPRALGGVAAFDASIDHPIHVAHKIQLLHSRGLTARLPNGQELQFPSLLSGPGADRFAYRSQQPQARLEPRTTESCVCASSTNRHKSNPESARRYERYVKLACGNSAAVVDCIPEIIAQHGSHLGPRLASSSARDKRRRKSLQTGHSRASSAFDALRNDIDDTVGAACVTWDGSCSAAGASSGGAWLKPFGSIGLAAINGAGAWAQSHAAALASGLAADAISGLYAEHAAKALATLDDGSASAELLLHMLQENRATLGVVVLQASRKDKTVITMSWAHTTPTFALGYVSIPGGFCARHFGADGSSSPSSFVPTVWISRASGSGAVGELRLRRV